MTAATAMARGRRAAEALMVDAGAITRAGTASGPVDEATGQYPAATRTSVYEGRCRLQIRGMGSSTTRESGGEQWVVDQTILQLPVVGSEDVRIGDRFEMVQSASDPAQTGRLYDITRRLSDKTHATKREFLLTEAGVTT